MTGQKKTTNKLIECVALRNLSCDKQVKAGNTFTCTPEQYRHFEGIGAAKKIEVA